jgi:hypothetical protein
LAILAMVAFSGGFGGKKSEVKDETARIMAVDAKATAVDAKTLAGSADRRSRSNSGRITKLEEGQQEQVELNTQQAKINQFLVDQATAPAPTPTAPAPATACPTNGMAQTFAVMDALQSINDRMR